MEHIVLPVEHLMGSSGGVALTTINKKNRYFDRRTRPGRAFLEKCKDMVGLVGVSGCVVACTFYA